MARIPDALRRRPFTFREAARSGLTRHDIRQMLADRQVTRILRDVYVPAGLPDSVDTRLAAASLVIPPFGIFCDRTAAWIHGVDALDVHELALPPRLDVVVLRDFTRRRRGQMTPRVRDLDPADIMNAGPVRVTTPLRTALDLGCQLHRRTALSTLDQFARHHSISASQLDSQLWRFRGRRGVIQLRGLIPVVDPRAESPAESWMRLTILDSGLPAPTPQFWVDVDGIATYRLDHAYPELKIAMEYDGVVAHGSDAQRRHDLIRRRWLTDNGWIVIVVTINDWHPAAVDEWTNAIRTAVAERRTPRHIRRFARPQAPRN